MLAVIVNSIAIVFGSIFGLIFGNKIKNELQEQVMNAIGLSVLFIGISSALKVENITLMVSSSAIGTIIGFLLDFEGKLYILGQSLKDMLTRDKDRLNSRFVEGFVSASLLYCTGSMAILGSISAGISKDYSILFTKSILDGVISIIFSATMGIGVMFSSIVIFVYQGAITLFAGYLQGFFTSSMIANISGVGGILLMGLGIDMLKIKHIKVANMLPAILFPVLYEVFISLF